MLNKLNFYLSSLKISVLSQNAAVLCFERKIHSIWESLKFGCHSRLNRIISYHITVLNYQQRDTALDVCLFNSCITSAMGEK